MKTWRSWTPERTEALCALLAGGASPTTVAADMGVSYEAARKRIRVVREAQEAAKAKPALRAPPVKRDLQSTVNSINAKRGGASPLSAAAKAAFSTVRAARFVALATSHPTAFEDLPRGGCKWPIGDIMARELVCCGGAALKDKPYCADHEKINRDKQATKWVDNKVIKPAIRRLAAA